MPRRWCWRPRTNAPSTWFLWNYSGSTRSTCPTTWVAYSRRRGLDRKAGRSLRKRLVHRTHQLDAAVDRGKPPSPKQWKLAQLLGSPRVPPRPRPNDDAHQPICVAVPHPLVHVVAVHPSRDRLGLDALEERPHPGGDDPRAGCRCGVGKRERPSDRLVAPVHGRPALGWHDALTVIAPRRAEDVNRDVVKDTGARDLEAHAVLGGIVALRRFDGEADDAAHPEVPRNDETTSGREEAPAREDQCQCREGYPKGTQQ